MTRFDDVDSYIATFPIPTQRKLVQLGSYRWSKGAIQFPIDRPLPVGLINKILRIRCDHLS